MVKYNKYIVTCAVTCAVTCGNMCSTYLKFVYIISYTIPSIIIITIYCYNEILSTTLLHKGVPNGVCGGGPPPQFLENLSVKWRLCRKTRDLLAN